MTNTSSEKTAVKPRFVTPQNIIKQKAGSGGLPDTVLKKAQSVIEDNPYDFKEDALVMVQRFDRAIVETESKTYTNQDNIVEFMNDVILAVMELKSNSGMFQYKLLSDVSSVSLMFAEEIEDINEDVFQVLRMQKKTMDVILAKNLKGEGGETGKVLISELLKANDRYFSKYPKTS